MQKVGKCSYKGSMFLLLVKYRFLSRLLYAALFQYTVPAGQIFPGYLTPATSKTTANDSQMAASAPLEILPHAPAAAVSPIDTTRSTINPAHINVSKRAQRWIHQRTAKRSVLEL